VSELVYVGAGKVIDPEPFSKEDVQRSTGDDGFPGLSKINFYPFVTFFNMERAKYGILATKGGWDADEIDAVVSDVATDLEVGPLTDFDNALKALKEREFSVFEDYPYVEITDEVDYVKALYMLGDKGPVSRKDWSPRGVQVKGKWEGPGVYDFLEMPPTFVDKTEQFEIESMEYYASKLLNQELFTDDEWRNDLNILISVLKDNQ